MYRARTPLARAQALAVEAQRAWMCSQPGCLIALTHSPVRRSVLRGEIWNMCWGVRCCRGILCLKFGSAKPLQSEKKVTRCESTHAISPTTGRRGGGAGDRAVDARIGSARSRRLDGGVSHQHRGDHRRRASGQLDAIARARQLLHQDVTQTVHRYALGPSLGQCCGGEVVLHFERVDASRC